MTVPSDFNPVADASALKKEYVGKKLSEIPTPAFIVNRKRVEKNCQAMLERAKRLNVDFRCHVKTHKCDEGVDYQLGHGANKTSKVVVSTMMEAWRLLPFIESGRIDDVLYGLPVVKSRIPEYHLYSTKVKDFRIMLDHPQQLELLAEYAIANNLNKKWSIFIKVDMGSKRAGLAQGSKELHSLVEKCLRPEISKYISVYGFYCHAGHSYASKDLNEAKSYLLDEINAANSAAKVYKSVNPDANIFISVGATPTSHSSKILDKKDIPDLDAKLELHAGNYPFCDLQQVSTACISKEDVACSVLADVISAYPGRGDVTPGEALVNAGVIAMAREPGPRPGYGTVTNDGLEGWYLGRLSQEHGILVPTPGSNVDFPELGSRVSLMPQHSCITANAFLWYYVTDGDDKVVDIWTTWRGW